MPLARKIKGCTGYIGTLSQASIFGGIMYELNDIVEMKKPHACVIKQTGKKANAWQVIRLGADIKIRCTNCGHVVMMSRQDFNKKFKKVLIKASENN